MTDGIVNIYNGFESQMSHKIAVLSWLTEAIKKVF